MAVQKSQKSKSKKTLKKIQLELNLNFIKLLFYKKTETCLYFLKNYF